MAASGPLWEEITHRCTSAHEPAEQLRKSLFAARDVVAKTRTDLVRTLVHTLLFHNSGTWPEITPREFTKLGGGACIASL